ncbi:MAG: sulfur oxidation c-type cytochrome SoxA [Proteobacteria bacterium]|nr:sulfur oxidation c-type cytochrome SoxA [Pseudomonadota bacterium]
MKSLSLLFLVLIISVPNAFADPEADRLALRAVYEKRFPDVPLDAHADGAYALDEAKREQWLEMEDFPPYEFTVDDGEVFYDTPFANGASYADCLGPDAPVVKQHYPRFDAASGEVVTLEQTLNNCRLENGEEALDYLSDELVAVTAYIAYQSRGAKIDIVIPDDPRALAAYEGGKQFFYERRGQLNFACSNCHIQMAGHMLRAERLSASLGQVTHWPAYRFKWEEVGPLHRRFARCNVQVRAEPFAQQSDVYRNLEYFMTYMSNGMELNGPSSRK